MRRFEEQILLLVLLADVTVSCGSSARDESGGGTGGVGGAAIADGCSRIGGRGGSEASGAAIPIADYEYELAKALCLTLVACGEEMDQATCEASSATGSNTLVAAVMRGTIVYDAVAAGACVRGWASQGCNYGAKPEACSRTFQGQIPAPGVCVANEECMDGLCPHDTATCSADFSLLSRHLPGTAGSNPGRMRLHNQLAMRKWHILQVGNLCRAADARRGLQRVHKLRTARYLFLDQRHGGDLRASRSGRGELCIGALSGSPQLLRSRHAHLHQEEATRSKLSER